MHDNTEDNAKRPAAFSKFWKQWGRKKGASEEGSEQPGLGRAPRANQGGSQKDPRNSGKSEPKTGPLIPGGLPASRKLAACVNVS